MSYCSLGEVAARHSKAKQGSIHRCSGRLSLVVMFSERFLLDEAEMETRKLSRDFDIPLDYTHCVFWLAYFPSKLIF